MSKDEVDKIRKKSTERKMMKMRMKRRVRRKLNDCVRKREKRKGRKG